MEKNILIAANLVAYLLFIYKCFALIEGMLPGKQYGRLFRLFIGAINAVLLVTSAVKIPINLSYLVSISILYIELLLLFRKSMKDTLFASLAVMMNIMCLRAMVISMFAFFSEGSLYSVYNNEALYLYALLVSNLLEWLALYIILHFMKLENLQVAMKDKTQSWYIIIWAGLCVVFMYRSTGGYLREYGVPYMFLDHLSYSFMLLLSFYYLLVYTFKLNKVAKIRETNKRLSMALKNQLSLQSALLREAIYNTQANLTQNKIVRGLDEYNKYIEQTHYNYDAWFEYACNSVEPAYYEVFWHSLHRQTLIDNFHQGIEPKPFEYQRKGSDKWLRLVLRVFQDADTDDIYVFGYGFDIDAEVRDKQALLKRVQTDLYTGLLNKQTTEELISERIINGIGVLFLIDIDDFKDFNDKIGHEAGDEVLKCFSNLLTGVFRKRDIVGRVGGDEFMVYISDTSDVSTAGEKATEILSRLQTGFDYNNRRLYINVSIGIAIINDAHCTFSEAYNQADNALYAAKANGKNSYQIFLDDVNAQRENSDE